MKTLLVICCLTATYNSFSQAPYPSLSPKGKLEQTVGLTDITVDYERPAARGRKIFGELVRYDKLWRTGAGHCTKIGFSKPVLINNKKIDKGTYSVLTIPGLHEWTVILNKDTTLYGIASYDETKDVVRFKTKPHPAGRYYESLTIDVDVIPNNAVVNISWEKTSISFGVETETDKTVTEFIQQYLLSDKSKDADEYAEAAEYYFYLDKQMDLALSLTNKAIALKNDAWYYRQKIDILEKQKKYQEAIACATLAIAINQQRAEWDSKTKQQSETEYKQRIEFFKSQLKK